jgi:hypothetical protein
MLIGFLTLLKQGETLTATPSIRLMIVRILEVPIRTLASGFVSGERQGSGCFHVGHHSIYQAGS